jgi:superfamily II DNA/RNA helicase
VILLALKHRIPEFTPVLPLWNSRPKKERTKFSVRHWNWLTQKEVIWGDPSHPILETTCSWDKAQLVSKPTEEILPELQHSISGLVGLELYDYQQAALDLMLRAERALLAAPIGSGKTLTCIAAINYCHKHLAPNPKTLIIAPKTLLVQWAEVFEKHSELEVCLLDSKTIPSFIASGGVGLILSSWTKSK